MRQGPGVAPSGLRAVPSGIWALGFVSLFMDVSSEMIHSLLPVYLVTALGTSALTVGVIEGIAEATAAITKVFSGALSDWLGRRKLLAIAGYGLAALTKPIFPLATSVGWLVAARFIDRVGKGIRGAPRDALVADLAPPAARGASFGLRQALDTVGAFLGPALAIALMWATADNFRAVFWVAVIPAIISVGVLIVAVKEPRRTGGRSAATPPLGLGELRRFGWPFWLVTAVAGVYTLARFSEAFLLLRAQSVGLAVMLVPLALVVMNLAYALAAYPAGALSDRVNRLGVLGIGLALLIAGDLALGLSSDLVGVGLGVLLWGLHMGFTQGLLSSLVADTAPAGLRGTAFGLFNMLTGLVLLAASLLAGLLWDLAGPGAPFLVGAGLAAVVGVGLVAIRWRLPKLGRVPGEEPGA